MINTFLHLWNSDYSSALDESGSDSPQRGRGTTEGRKLLKFKLAAQTKKRAEARERGGTPAFKKRTSTMSNVGMVKCGLLTQGVDMTLSPREKQR